MHVHKHSQRVNEVANYITRHPAEEHSLEKLAAIAQYSGFHFHRLFKERTGQTPSQFVWHHRLDRAARILAYDPRQRITEVASACGFSSAANFAKAFRPMFGLSPRELRGNWHYLQSHSKTIAPKNSSLNLKQHVVAQAQRFARAHAASSDSSAVDDHGVSLRYGPSYRVAYLRNYNSYYLPQNLDPLFERIHQWLTTVTAVPIMIGVSRSYPSITSKWRCQFDACGVLPAGVEPPRDMSVQTLEGGLTAVFRCELGPDDSYFYCQTLLNWLTNEWLLTSGYQPDDRPVYELYLEDSSRNPRGNTLLELCLPVRPLSESVCMA